MIELRSFNEAFREAQTRVLQGDEFMFPERSKTAWKYFDFVTGILPDWNPNKKELHYLAKKRERVIANLAYIEYYNLKNPTPNNSELAELESMLFNIPRIIERDSHLLSVIKRESAEISFSA